jgi:hypothetical protein
VAQFKYLGTTLTNENLIQKEIKRRSNLPSRLLSKNVKIRIYRIIILPMVLYGCENWSLTLEERRLRVFDYRVLRIFGPKRDEVIGDWRKLHNEELHNLYCSPSIIRITKSRRMRWAGHLACIRRRRMHIGFLWESQKERDH